MRTIIENLFTLAGMAVVLGSMHVAYREIVFSKPEKAVIYSTKVVRYLESNEPTQKMQPVPYWWDLDSDTVEINRRVPL